MRFLTASAQHIGARPSQEDSFGFSDAADRDFVAHGGVAAVLCDGMGGMLHGAEAASTAVEAFLAAYQAKTPQESIPAALERGVHEANRKVFAFARRLGAEEGMGTTLVAAILQKNLLYYASVGDSGVFHFARGGLRMINHPHVFAVLLDQAVARGVMTQQAALEHPERDALTSFIGVETLSEVDTSTDPLRLTSGETILLASDGLFNTLSSREIKSALEGDPRNWPETLIARTLEKKHEYQDNVTVLTMTLLSQ
jgi:protein phosphatase